jgi:HD-GYP domain-containing protein (c-di-GMP phosphodiesterase class II)
VAQYNEHGPELRLSISIGSALRDEPPAELQGTLQRADDAMYQQKMQQAHHARSTTVSALTSALEARDHMADGHAERLRDWGIRLAEAFELSADELERVKLLARYHDLGKVGLSEELLFKRGPLTEAERGEMERHSEIGYRIAETLSDLSSIAELILHHHEHWDGGGYPRGLSGEQIPLASRIIAVADAFDAMTHDRPYRAALSHQNALAELRRCAGTQFDPSVVERFVALVPEADTR